MYYLMKMCSGRPDSKLRLHTSEGISMPVSDRHGTSLRQTLIEFINTTEYSLICYTQFKDLELAVRNEILYFRMDLRPE